MSKTDTGDASFEKAIPFKKTDSDRRVVTGVAMEPNRVDLVGDFERAETIRRLSDDYMERLAGGNAGNGVMHVKFPGSESITHVENRVLDKAETIGDTEYPAGTWVIAKRVDDDTLWSLIESDVITGYSIGGRIQRSTEYDTLPDDVIEDDEVKARTDGEYREIMKAEIHEISFVDRPAVPRARIAKSDALSKAATELTGGTEAATDYLKERGHDDTSAESLAGYLNGSEKAEPSWFSRARNFFKSEPDEPEPEEKEEKAGRVLSGDNVDGLMAAHDAILGVLQSSGHGKGRRLFSDDPRVPFDVDTHQGKASPSDESAESDTGSDNSETMSTDDFKAEMAELIDKRIDEALGQDEEEEKSDEDTLEDKVDALASGVESLTEEVTDIKSAQGESQQDGQGGGGDDGELWGKNSPFYIGGDN